MRALSTGLIKHLGLYVKNSPRLRRWVLGLLSLSPWLSVKFRRLYLGSQLGADHSAAAFGLPAAEGSETGILSAPRRCDGVNAGQRTPL